MRPVYLKKEPFLRFFPPAHFDHWKLRQAACAPGDHGTNVSDEIDQKMKVGQNTCFFLRFFSAAHFDLWKLRQTACVPGDHGDHGTSGPVTVCWSVVTILLCQAKSSLSDKWLKSLEIQLSKVVWVGGWLGHLIIVSLQISSERSEWTWSLTISDLFFQYVIR